MSQGIDPFALRRIQVLDALEPPALEALAKHLRSRRFVDGAKICIEGQEDEHCFFLMSGMVRVVKDVGDGRTIPLATLREGTLFGQAGLIEGQARTAQVEAVGEVDVLSLERATLDWALARKEPWAVSLQQVLAVTIMRQLRSALERFEQLVALAPEDRQALVEGETVSRPRQEAVYMNLSGSFAELPSAAPPSYASNELPATPSVESLRVEERSEEDKRLYELLQVVSQDEPSDE